MTAEAPPAGAQRQLWILAGALVLAMSPWFSTAAVLGELRDVWDLSRAEASWLTIIVQIGFVVGAVTSTALRVADRLAPRRLVLAGAVGAAVANLVVVTAGGFELGLVGRFLTGASLAFVYPPAMKAMSSWYRTGRGFALGVMIGALTLGSALPHLINAVGGVSWRPTLIAVSIITLVGGCIAEVLGEDGPFGAAPAVLNLADLRSILANREFRLASLGYFGHMWELYAMWAWVAAYLGDVFDSERQASLGAFAAIGMGAFGSVYAGVMSDRRSRAVAARQALRWSGLLAVVTGFLVDLPTILPLLAVLIWGFWVVADSAQFSTIVTEVTPPHQVGTALTVQLATGFVLTIFTIFLVPVVRDNAGWGLAFLLLAPGPIVGAIAMSRLASAE